MKYDAPPSWKRLSAFLHIDPLFWSPFQDASFHADESTAAEFRRPYIELETPAGSARIFEDNTLLSATDGNGRERLWSGHISSTASGLDGASPLAGIARVAFASFLEAARELHHEIAHDRVLVWARWHTRRAAFERVPRDAWNPGAMEIDWEADSVKFRDGELLCSVHVERVGEATRPENPRAALRQWILKSIQESKQPTKSEVRAEGNRLGFTVRATDIVRDETLATLTEAERQRITRPGRRPKKGEPREIEAP